MTSTFVDWKVSDPDSTENVYRRQLQR